MSQWTSEPLSSGHDLTSFACGQQSLDEWLRSTALRAQAADVARTYVWTAGDARVIAYYSIAPTQIVRGDVSRRQTGGFTVVPAYLLARLALDRSLQGRGLGSQLLIDALEVIVEASRHSGGRLVVVDAIDDAAAAFYRRYDFEPVKNDDHRLVMTVATARRALGMWSMSVTPNQESRLTSLVFELPDGGSVPVVMSTTEVREVATRLQVAADEAAATGEGSVSLRGILADVLGRDPFDS